jgi:hypothetical protein
MTLSIPDCGAATAGGALVLDDGVPLAVASPALDGSALGVGVDVCVPAASPARLIVEVTVGVSGPTAHPGLPPSRCFLGVGRCYRL